MTVGNSKIEWKIEKFAGHNLAGCRPYIDATSSFVFCASDNELLVFEVDSGLLIDRLSQPSAIVAIELSPLEKDELLVCTRCCTINVWSITERKLKRSFRFLEGVAGKFSVVDGTFFGVATPFKKSKAGGDELRAYKFALQHEIQEVELVDLHGNLPEDLTAIEFAPNYTVCIAGENIFLLREEKRSKYYLTNGRLFTCVSCHPRQDSVAAGDSSGRILIWTNVSTQRKIHEMSHLIHWHTMPVADIQWTFEGNSLISGAAEGVLVKHALHSRSKFTTTYLPRLGEPIVQIFMSPDFCLLGAVLDDNSIKICRSNTEVLVTLAGLLRASVPVSVGLVSDQSGCCGEQTAGTLILNGRPGHLQIYSTHEQTSLMQIDVSRRNLPLYERSGRLSYSHVLRATTAANHLATMECHSDHLDTHKEELLLKFWHFDSATNKLELETCAEYPHSGRVTCLCSSPADDLCVASTSEDGTAKVWERQTTDSVDGAKSVWFCSRTLRYHKLAALCASFSGCGSVLAVGFGCHLTLWDTKNGDLLAARVPYAAVQSDITNILWGRFGAEHLIVCSTENALCCWDTHTLHPCWVVAEPVTALTHDTHSNVMAAVLQKHALFEPFSSEPLGLIEIDDLDIIDLAFVPPENKSLAYMSARQDIANLSSTLYLLSSDQALYAMVSPQPKRTTRKRRRSIQEIVTPFTKMLQEERIKDEKTPVISRERNLAANVELLSGPAHSLPALDVLAASFINSCLIRKET